tara:strand:+ start:181 stop:399 length:219 start_codon:yes stop_codon:yes gene_type:complete
MLVLYGLVPELCCSIKPRIDKRLGHSVPKPLILHLLLVSKLFLLQCLLDFAPGNGLNVLRCYVWDCHFLSFQ